MSKLKGIWAKLAAYWRRVAQEDSTFFLLLAIFHLTIISQVYSSLHHPTAWQIIKSGLHFVPSLFECFLLVIICHFLPLKPRRVIQSLILLFFGVLFIVDVFLFTMFNTFFDMEKMDIVTSVEPQTAIEFISTYILAPRALLAVILGILALVGGYILLRRYASRICQRATNIILVFLLLAVFAFGSMLTKCFYVLASDSVAGKREFRSAMMWEINSRFYSTSLIVRVAEDMYNFSQINKSADEAMAVLDAGRQPILYNGSDIPYVVLVLGEATDRNKMSLYGYHLDTTPRLQMRWKQDSLVRFDDTISGAVSTTEAMRQIFSFAEKGDAKRWYEHGCLLDIMHDAGYHTAWLSNQTPSDVFGTMDKFLSYRADEVSFVTLVGRISATSRYDEYLLPILDASLARNTADKTFYVLHLMGAHEQFNMRYPDSIAKFSANDEEAETAYRRQIKADYDNAIYYNDMIMDEIFKRFEDKNAIVIYLSDHGEEVCEGSDFAGHSMENSSNRHMVEIPMMVWTSPSFNASHPELLARIQESTQQPFCSDDLIHAILDLVDVRVQDYEPQRSLWNSAYVPKERIFGGEVYQRAE